MNGDEIKAALYVENEPGRRRLIPLASRLSTGSGSRPLIWLSSPFNTCESGELHFEKFAKIKRCNIAFLA